MQKSCKIGRICNYSRNTRVYAPKTFFWVFPAIIPVNGPHFLEPRNLKKNMQTPKNPDCVCIQSYEFGIFTKFASTTVTMSGGGGSSSLCSTIERQTHRWRGVADARERSRGGRFDGHREQCEPNRCRVRLCVGQMSVRVRRICTLRSSFKLRKTQ